jgi:hypothetical protein
VPQVRALETNLWGYRFRSRLEARWAVFFDYLGEDWQYETEGFMLPSGPYLPDFFLPQMGLWFEVKGAAADAEEIQRCEELRYSDYPVLLAEGSVGGSPLRLFAFDISASNGGSSEWPVYFVSFAEFGMGGLQLMSPQSFHQKRIVDHQFNDLKCKVSSDPHQSLHWHQLTCSDAINAARSARFEHGQSPERRSSC